MKKTLLLFLLAAAAQAQTAQFKPLDSALTYLAANHKFMGSVCLRDKDKVVFSKAYGWADQDKKILADTKTRYKIGSITKMFTASIVFQLIEEKKLALDTKLSVYFPQVKNAEKITIANLLGHSSGIFNFTNDETFGDFAEKPQTQQQMVDRIAAYPSDFEPGSKTDYSNSNYVLLGYIIEKITKKPYRDNIMTRVAKKAGLTDTQYYGAINPNNHEAFSYAAMGDQWEKREQWDESVASAAGALQSTTEDLTRFERALFEGKIVSKTSLEAMKPVGKGFGKGMFAFPFNEKTFYGHTGGIEGFSSMLGYNPEDGAGFAMSVNGADYDTNEIAIMALSSFYGKSFKFPTVSQVKVDENRLKSYAGSYATAAMPLKITVTFSNGALTAQAPGQGSFPLTPLSDTEFEFKPAGLKMTFGTDSFVLDQGGMKFDFAKEKN